MRDVLTIGELLIDFIPNQTNKPAKDIESFTRCAGGAPANVAATVAKLGGSAYFVGQVGKDFFGEYLIEQLDKAKVKTCYIKKTDEAKTSLAFVALDAFGEREFMFYRNPGADELFNENQLPENIRENSILHFCSVSLSDYPIKKAHIALIKKVKENKGFISFDPNIRLNLWSDHKKYLETIKAFILYSDLLKISSDELFFITEGKNKIEDLFIGDVKYIILTKGKDGVEFYFKNEKVINHKGFKVKTVDTTGAGDAFIGAFLYQLSIQEKVSLENIDSMLVFANATAALVTTKYGAIDAIPNNKEVNSFIEKGYIYDYF